MAKGRYVFANVYLYTRSDCRLSRASARFVLWTSELRQLVYVSESLIGGVNAEEAVADMVAAAQMRNDRLNVTGALLYTGDHFAQILEGPSPAIDELMVSICRDDRHHNVNVLSRVSIILRRFINWRMAYDKPSPYLSRFLQHAFHTTAEIDKLRSAHQIVELACEYSVTRGTAL